MTAAIAATPTHTETRRYWPIVAAVALAVLTVVNPGPDGVELAAGADLAQIVAASALVYLGAAALRNQAAAWPVFIGEFVAITVGDIVGFDSTWLFFAAAVVFVGYGLATGALRPRHGLPLQTVAMLGFGAIAVAALAASPTIGAYLVAAGLFGHAAWDVHHHRTNRVVVRSMAEFCVVLDTLLAIAIIAATLL